MDSDPQFEDTMVVDTHFSTQDRNLLSTCVLSSSEHDDIYKRTTMVNTTKERDLILTICKMAEES